LGMANDVGSLVAGKQADLAAFSYAGNHADPYNFIFDPAERADRVWVAGREVSIETRGAQNAS
jgi:cytosine/adenosine deaminase-related metal-dependent hydrolase